MSGNILDRYAPRVVESAKKQPDEAGAIDDLGAFSILRGVQDRSIMLELRLKDGNSVAFNYSYLVQASFDPSHGITLQFGGKNVILSGSNLNAEIRPNLRLYQALLRHRVPWVREADRHDQLQAPPGSVIIDSIDVSE
jgi:hypothetical protein